jgi:hypothetical protein
MVYQLLEKNIRTMIRVISVHLNDSRFITYQKKLLDKFMLNPFEFIVFDDSGNNRNYLSRGINDFDPNVRKNIASVCEELGITRIEVPVSVHENPGSVHPYRSYIIDHPGEWCANSLQYAVNYCRENYSDCDIILNIDSDMFPILPIDIENHMENYNLLGVPQVRTNELISVEYLWNGLFAFRPKNIDWSMFYWDTCDVSDDLKITSRFSGVHTDVGGLMFFYLRKHPDYKKIIHLYSGSWNRDMTLSQGIEIPEILLSSLEKDPRNTRGLYFSEFYPPGFLHYRAGGNWDSYTNHSERKENIFKSFDIMLG